MRSTAKNKPKSPEILSEIKGNMHREDFATYMGFCVKKWKRLEVELQIVDAIISSICKQWNISKEKLMDDRKFAEPRALMYYIIKKQVKLSYGEIGEMFGVNKSYIFKSVTDITFLVEGHGQKSMVTAFQSIQKDLSKKASLGDDIKN
jgi:hypothetical protein